MKYYIPIKEYRALHLKALLLLLPLLLGLLLTSCQKELEVQTDFPFEIHVMPVPKAIDSLQTVEIRCQIKPKGNYSGTRYTIRYFPNGKGIGKLQLKDGLPFKPNDSYPLPEKTFRLYYTALSANAHEFDIFISDNFGNERTVSFNFN